MALATLNDVKRVLGINLADASHDIELQQALDAVEEWVQTRLRFQYNGTPQTRSYYTVRDDERLILPARNVTVTSVVVDGVPVDFRQEGGILRLLGDGGWTYEEVVVTMAGVTNVPASLELGVALLVANKLGLVTSEGEAQIVSESLGDYSYSLREPGGASSIDREVAAYKLLKPYLRRGVVVV